MNFFQLGLGQIVPNAWRLVVSFLVLALREKITPSIELFNLFFKIFSHPGKNSWYYFRGREGKSLISNPISSVKEWKGKFVYIKVEGMERSWNFNFAAPTLKLKAAAKNYSTAVQKLEALGIVSASNNLLSNESMAEAGVFNHGR